MTSKQGRNFPLPLGVIMLPLLFVSLVGIIVFSFNIIFADDKIQIANSPSVKLQNKKAWADTAHANPIVSVPPSSPAAASENQNKNAAAKLPGNAAVKAEKAEKAEKVITTEPQIIELAVPVGGIKSQNAAAKKNDPVNDRPAREVKPAVNVKKGQNKTANAGPAKNVPLSTGAQNWQIQAGAFSVRSSAVQVGNKITALGYAVKIVGTGAAKPISRVIVSPGKNRDAPKDALKKLNSIGIEGYIISGRP